MQYFQETRLEKLASRAAKSSLSHFVFVLFAFVVFDLVSSVLSQEIGFEERLRNDLFCVDWDV